MGEYKAYDTDSSMSTDEWSEEEAASAYETADEEKAPIADHIPETRRQSLSEALLSLYAYALIGLMAAASLMIQLLEVTKFAWEHYLYSGSADSLPLAFFGIPDIYTKAHICLFLTNLAMGYHAFNEVFDEKALPLDSEKTLQLRRKEKILTYFLIVMLLVLWVPL